MGEIEDRLARYSDEGSVLWDAVYEIAYWRKQAELWKRAARCWQDVAHRFGTVTAEQARDAITEAEDHERRV